MPVRKERQHDRAATARTERRVFGAVGILLLLVFCSLICFGATMTCIGAGSCAGLVKLIQSEANAARDAGLGDAGLGDASVMDAKVRDASSMDASSMDASVMDATDEADTMPERPR